MREEIKTKEVIKGLKKRTCPSCAAACVAMAMTALTSCEGVLDGIYDEPQPVRVSEGQIVIDATSWTDWYYVDLAQLRRLEESGDSAAFADARSHFEPWPIPMELTGEHDGRSGQYLYWFDVWGEGITNNEPRSCKPCDAQSEPESWSFAVHRNNVRTNGGAVCKTSFTSMQQLPPSGAAFADSVFVADEWTENVVWDSQEQMLLCLVPSQGIAVNRVLSSWLNLHIPPVPPTFTHDGHVFILRLADGTYAALQLANYMSPSGVKCWLTINYKYPY